VATRVPSASGTRRLLGLGAAGADERAVHAGGLETARQIAQVLSEAKNDRSRMTGLIVVTSLPTSSTMPTYSWPIGVGEVTGLMPR